MTVSGKVGHEVVRRLMADLRLMRLRTADVAANVCIRDERGAVVDPLLPLEIFWPTGRCAL